VGQDTGGYEDGFAGDRYARALQHYSQEDDQVAILLDQNEDVVHGLQGPTILLVRRISRDKDPREETPALAHRPGSLRTVVGSLANAFRLPAASDSVLWFTSSRLRRK
jgi:hypothetical protein